MIIMLSLKKLFGRRKSQGSQSQSAPGVDNISHSHQAYGEESLYSEEGLPHIFVESPYITDPTYRVPTPLGDVVVQRNPCLLQYNFNVIGKDGELTRKAGEDRVTIAGFYVSDLEPVGYLPPSVSTYKLRAFKVNPIPQEQRDEVAKALASAGYKGEFDFEPSRVRRLGVTQCPTGISLTPDEVCQGVGQYMDLARIALGTGRPKEAVDYLVQAETLSDKMSREHRVYVDTFPSIPDQSGRRYIHDPVYTRAVKSPEFRELWNRAYSGAYSAARLEKESIR